MAFEHALLGLLIDEPMAGHALGKRFRSLTFLPWQGTNHQLYKTIGALQKKGWTHRETIPQDGLPAKKVSYLTEEGIKALDEWLAEAPKALEPKNPILPRLAWADRMGARRVEALLAEYEKRLAESLALANEQTADLPPQATDLKKLLWVAIEGNIRKSYEEELRWVKDLRLQIAPLAEVEAKAEEAEKDEKISKSGVRKDDRIRCEVMESDGKRYLHYHAIGGKVNTLDATLFAGDCIEQCVNRVMLHESVLPEGFFRLRTGLAGEVLQKLVQYRIKTAFVLESGQRGKGKFQDMMAEANRGNAFRSFKTVEEAERWLLTDA